jgi:hypothetical protein
MIQLKRFDLMSEVEDFNKFCATHPGAGKDPIKYNENSIFYFYDDGVKFSKNKKLEFLYSSLEKEEADSFASKHEIALAEAMLKEYMARPEDEANKYQKMKFKEETESKLKLQNKEKGLIDLKIEVIKKLIKEVEKDK